MGDVVICPLCIHFEPEIFGDYFVVAKCGHYFHHHCIMKVINRGVDRCPLNCKIPISPKKLTKLFGIDPNASCSYSSSNASYGTLPVSTYDYCFKLVLLGNSGVGKSCLMRRFSEDVFMENIQSTPGVDLVRKVLNIGGKIVHLIIWDTAGQETFNSIISTCVRDVQGILFVYDSTRPESLDNITTWMDFAKEYGPKDTIKILVGNKTDKKDQHAVSESYGKAIAESMGMPFIETSAKDDLNVETAFRILTGKILESEWILAAVKDKNNVRTSTIRLDEDSYSSEDSGGCAGWFKKNFDIAMENISKGLRFMGINDPMGKRKSRRKPPPKVKAIVPLDTQFNCPFCNHEKSCDVKLDKTRKTGRITCRVCMECFQTQIHHLSEPIDVYNDWIDACETAN